MNGDSFNKTTFYFHGAFLDLKAALRDPWRYSEINKKKPAAPKWKEEETKINRIPVHPNRQINRTCNELILRPQNVEKGTKNGWKGRRKYEKGLAVQEEEHRASTWEFGLHSLD